MIKKMISCFLHPCLNRSEEHTSELQSLTNLVCRLLLEIKKTPARKTVTDIIRIKPSSCNLNTVRHPRRFKIVVIDIQITLKQMLRDFIGIRVNRAKKSGMVNITCSIKSRERSGLNTFLPVFSFFFNDTATTEISTLTLLYALPI